MKLNLDKNLASFNLDCHLGYQKLLDRINNLAWLMDNKGIIYLTNKNWKKHFRKISDTNKRKEDTITIIDFIPSSKLSNDFLQRIQTSQKNYWEWELKLGQRSISQQYKLSLEKITEDNKLNPLWLIVATPIVISKDNGKTSTYVDLERGAIDYQQKQKYALRHAEFIRRILESNQDCIKVLDPDCRLLYMNHNGQQVMEIDDFSQQIENKIWVNFWHGGDRQAASQAFGKALAGDVGKFDGFCTTAKGTPKWWEVIVTPMFDENNNVTEILSVSRDITARKIAEQSLEKRNQELERFASVVSHDLKAPLRAVHSLSQWILEDLEGQINAETKQHLNLLQERVIRMDEFINSLLNYARAGKEKLAAESVNLALLLKEITDSLSPPEGFKVIATTPLPTLTTKKLLLSQVLSNLISNAIKHHDCDCGIVSISAEDLGDCYQITVADDGGGIAKANREKIFEIFQTFNQKTATKNTGIGLALVKKIISEEKNKLWVEDNIPRGSKFCFTWGKT